MSYKPYSIKLSQNQKKLLAKSYNSRQAITLRLKNSQLKNGNDEMLLTKTQINQIQKSIKNNKGLDLKISKSQISKVVQKGGNLFSTLLTLGSRLLPMATKIGSKVLPGLSTGVLSSLGSFATDKILGSGQIASGPQNRPAPNFSGSNIYQIPNQNLGYLKNYIQFLTNPQKLTLRKALQKGEGMNIKLTRSQSQNGGFLGLLASIGIPILADLLLRGKGLQNRPYYQNYRPPPFIGNWPRGSGNKKSKKKTKLKKGKGLILGKNSPFTKLGIPILGDIL